MQEASRVNAQAAAWVDFQEATRVNLQKLQISLGVQKATWKCKKLARLATKCAARPPLRSACAAFFAAASKRT